MTAIAAPTAALPAAPTPVASGKASADGFDVLLAIAGRSDDAPSPRPAPRRAEAKSDDRDADRDANAADRPARTEVRSDAKAADHSDEARAEAPRREADDTVDGAGEAHTKSETLADKTSDDEPQASEAGVDVTVEVDTTLASAQAAAMLIAAMTAEAAPVTQAEVAVDQALAAASGDDAAVFAAAVETLGDAPLVTPQMAAETTAETAAATAPQTSASATTAVVGEQALDAAALEAMTALAGEAGAASDATTDIDRQSSTPNTTTAQAKTAETTIATAVAPTLNAAQAQAAAPIAQAAPPVEATVVAEVAPAAEAVSTDAAEVAPAVASDVAAVSVKSADTAKAQAAPAAAPAAVMAAEAVETPEAVTAVAASDASGDANVNGDAGANANGADSAAVTLEASAAGANVAEAAPSSTPAPPVQLQAAGNAAAPAAAPAAVRGSPETVAALSAEILKKADAKTTRFDVALTPDGLGKVDVRIEIGRDGALTASMRFDTVHAAQELRGKANELRQALSDAGFNVADNALSFDVSSQGGQSQNPFFAFEGWGDQGQRAFSGRAFQAALTGEEDITITPELLPGLKTVADSGLDIRI